MRLNSVSAFYACAIGLSALSGFSETGKVPAPLSGHPGNVCLEGERLAVALTPEFREGMRWELSDVDGQRVMQGVCAVGAKAVEVEPLPIGWYRLAGFGADGKPCAQTTAAVLRKWSAPVPANSPVCIDTANAWFSHVGTPQEDLRRMAEFASLAALAGVSGVRDRLTWGELETAPGVFQAQTCYDDSARILNEAGLQVLQVFHSTPAWAQAPQLDEYNVGGRYPRDLRDSYRFCKAMAVRFKGKVQAWEPWNEANMTAFGGHTIDEMCALQKASYLGFKAGDPALTVCWNVYAGPGTPLHAQGIVDNACWPYFDTYDIHSYSGVEQYLGEFEPGRQGACGKPLWISECGILAQWSGANGDFSDDEEVRQARFVPKSYASSLFAGVSRHYFFILGNYCETSIQFGLLRHDLTPRRGYLALAAVGRLLADAQPLGRMTNGALRVYAFRAQPDGEPHDVLVAWSDRGTSPFPAVKGLSVAAAYDGFGRLLVNGLPKELGEAPVFAVLPKDGSRKLSLEAPLAVAPVPRAATCSPVVMQTVLPQSLTRLDVQAHQVVLGEENTVPVAVYNFGDVPVSGTLKVETPAGVRVTAPTGPLSLQPMERQVLSLKAVIGPESGRSVAFGAPVTVKGDFGPAGESLLSFRLVADLGAVKPAVAVPIASAAKCEVWRDNIVGGSKMTHELRDGRMIFTMDFGDQDPWGYPHLTLAPGERPPEGADGLMAEIEVLEGRGDLRAQFLEEGGASYLTDLFYNFDKRGPQRVVALFGRTAWGPFSGPDADGKLTPSSINGLLIGINAQKHSRVRLAVGNVQWVRF